MGISEGYGIGSLKPGVCTSSTRPASPFDGQVVYMTDVDQTAVWDGSAWVGLDLSRDRNVVINGAMQVAQRGTSTASITTTSYNTADRWFTDNISQGTWTQSVEADAPTGSGFRNSLKMLCTTASASPASGSRIGVGQRFEGQNIQKFAKGTASAKPFVMSFWTKSNVTGTYVIELFDTDNTRYVSASYTISASATWEYKTVTFPADTTGAFNNDNNESLAFRFWLGAGSSYSSGTPLNTTWGAPGDTVRIAGQVNVAAATNNYWQVTGVQLEAGAVATPFEFEDHETTLSKCQRYYFLLVSGTAKSFGVGAMITATEMQTHIYFPTTMRTTPTLVATSGSNYYDFVRNGGDDLFNSLTIVQASSTGAGVGNATEIAGTVGHAGRLLTIDSLASIAFSAEL